MTGNRMNSCKACRNLSRLLRQTRVMVLCVVHIVCRNKRDFPDSRDIHIQLYTSGFMPGYKCWTKHGEIGVMMEDEEEDNNDDYPMFPEQCETENVENEEQQEEEVEIPDEPVDDLGRVIADAKRYYESEKDTLKFG